MNKEAQHRNGMLYSFCNSYLKLFLGCIAAANLFEKHDLLTQATPGTEKFDIDRLVVTLSITKLTELCGQMVTIVSSAPHHHEAELDDMLCLVSEPASLWVLASHREALLTWLCDHKPINAGKSPLTSMECPYHLTSQEECLGELNS